MLRSLFAGISGLRAHQQMMDVTANNIANVNTVGYKTGQTTFEDTLSQMLTAAGAPTGTALGGTNPAQIGLGVKLAGITTNFTQGASQTTGRGTDLMINGDGFFMVNNGAENLYTRAGSFNFDAQGNLVAPDGARVQGWNAVNGVLTTNAAPTGIQIPLNQTAPPSASLTATIAGDIPGNGTGPYTTMFTVYDSQGTAHALTAQFTGPGPAYTVNLYDGPVTTPLIGTTTVTFNANGSLSTASPLNVSIAGAAWAALMPGNGGTIPAQSINLDITSLTNYAATAPSLTSSADGYGTGSLQAYSIGPDGTISGTFSNGAKLTLGQIAMATFTNPPGLEKVGDSDYRATVNSGVAQVGVAGNAGRGTLQAGALEMSNVDLAQEFTNLVISQRGFEANSKVITTSDELLQDLINLKR